MASTAKTQEFFIGDLELRASVDLTKAGELGPSDSMGLMIECTVSMTTNEAKLQAGFPQRTYATAVTSRDLEIKGSLSEYTTTNLAMLYGDENAWSVALAASTGEGTTSTTVLADGTDLILQAGEGSDFAAGDFIYIRSALDATDVFAIEIASVNTDTLTLVYGVPREFAIDSIVVKSSAIVLGSADALPPMCIQVVGVMPLDGEPFIYDIWKATIAGTVEVTSSTDKFGTLPYTISPLTPATSEIDCDVYGTDAAKKAMLKKFIQGRLVKGFTAGAAC